MNALQPMLPGFQDLVGNSAAEAVTRKKIRRIDERQFPLALGRALTSENLSFATYTIMIAAHASEAVSIARLSALSGMSYHAVRNQTIRTPWWIEHTEKPLLTVSLSAEGRKKLERIATRLSTNTPS